jgi:hypothetical protein
MATLTPFYSTEIPPFYETPKKTERITLMLVETLFKQPEN